MFFIVLFFIGLKSHAKDSSIEHEFSQLDADYELTTFLRVTAGESTVADLLAQRLYAQSLDEAKEVNGLITDAANSFFSESAQDFKITLVRNSVRLEGKGITRLTAPEEETNAKTVIPMAKGELVIVELSLHK